MRVWHARAHALRVNGDDFLVVTVARGPVPRELSISAENARSPETTDVCCSARCMARDRPSPYGESGNAAIKHSEGQALALR